MTEQELIIGEKYVPISKSVGSPLDTSVVWGRAKKKEQPYLFYVKNKDGFYCFSENQSGPGDYFLPSDVIPYIDPLAKYKLLVQRYDELELLYAIKIAPIDTKELTWKGWKRVSELRAEINELKKELK